jgi:hypothetical protein
MENGINYDRVLETGALNRTYQEVWLPAFVEIRNSYDVLKLGEY